MGCVFCKIVAGEIPSRIVYSDDTAIAILDMSPAQKGHTLMIPRRHTTNLLESPEVLSEISKGIGEVSSLLVKKLAAQGLNLLANSGEVAGQSVFHTHIHLIPRYANNPGVGGIVGEKDATDLDEVHNLIVSA